MKPALHWIRLTQALLALGCLIQNATAAITGQWDFKKGDLTATIGQDMGYLDGETQGATQFGTTTSFGIPDIGGQSVKVMKFPQVTTEFGGFVAPAGAAANGGGNSVNQYTVIMDLLFPTNSSAKIRALFLTDNNGEFVADANNAIGSAGGSADGNLTPNAWHRVAFAVDTAGTISKYVDGAKVGEENSAGGVDGRFAVTSLFYLFDDASTNSAAGYIASLQVQDQKLPEGLIAALGVPTPTGILTGPPPNPYVVSKEPVSDLRFPGRSSVPPNPTIQIVLADGKATVDTNSVVLKFNDQVVKPVISKVGATTTISYAVTNLLAGASSNTVALAYQDSSASNLGIQFAFTVGSYIALPVSAANPPGSGKNPGFSFRVVQAPSEDAGVQLQNNYFRAVEQLNGTLLNTNGVAFTNGADLTGANADGSFDVNSVIAFELQGNALNAFPNVPGAPFPGIPGADDNTQNFADETFAYLDLSAGTHVFGVDVGIDRVDSPPGADDGYRLYAGANPRDYFSTLVGQFLRTGDNFNDRQNTNEFTFVAPVAGLYPFRLVHWQNNLGANLAWYSVDLATGNRVLINDASDPASIKAYRQSTVAREPYVAEVNPPPGAAGVTASTPITVLLGDDDLAADQSSIKLALNGSPVVPTVVKSGKLTTLTYNPNATRTTVTNTLQLVYSDNATPVHSFTNEWAFTIVVAGALQAQVTGQWDFNKGDLSATVGKDLQYLDGLTGQSAANTAFGTTTSMGLPDIKGVSTKILWRKGKTSNAIGYIMDHGIAPNGGGQLVNQYTIIFDIYKTGGTTTLFNCQNTNNTTDGSLFWQGNDIGQGSGGYVSKGTATPGVWHRIALAADLAATPPVITKFVDGIKQQDWVQTGLDLPRRSWQHTVLLIADGDGDDMTDTYVSSVQVRNGKLSDAQLVFLGGASPDKIPQNLPETHVTGQWDFQNGDLSATIGNDLQYLDGLTGQSVANTVFGTTTTLGVADINGTPAKIMERKGNTSNAIGYIMDHGIGANGGGQLVNVYTIIFDIFKNGGTTTLFNCQNTNNTTDGSIFWQGNDIGQGAGGYVSLGTATPGVWHRIALAADMGATPPVITKFVDGIKQQDWVQPGKDLPRRSWQHTVLLIADGDGDDMTDTFIRSVQVSSVKLTDDQLIALGGASADGIPVVVPNSAPTDVPITISRSANGLTLSWPASAVGFVLESTDQLVPANWQVVPGVVNNSITIPIGTGSKFLRLHKP